MALTNSGFNGTVNEAQWAYMSAIGDADGVQSTGAWAVTQGTGRQVSVAASAGYAFAKGVLSIDSGSILKALSTPTNGQWFLIVRRINWSTDTVTIEALAHTTTSTSVPTAPPTGLPTMSSTPGTEYDQKLAWAWVRSSDTTLVVFDLRGQPVGYRLDVIEPAVPRQFSTVALALAWVPPAARYTAVADDAPGGTFRWSGSAWELFGTPRFASSSARSSALASPQIGWRSYLLDTKREYLYDGSNWIDASSRGLVPLYPAATGTGVTVDAVTGLITCSGTTTLSIPGLTGFRSYRLRARTTAKSASAIDHVLRVMSGTTPDSTSGNYRGHRVYWTGAATTPTDMVTSQTFATLEAGGLAEARFEVVIASLNENVPTFIESIGSEITAAAQYSHKHSFRHNASPSNVFNGLQLLLSGAGNFNGEYQILGEG